MHENALAAKDILVGAKGSKHEGKILYLLGTDSGFWEGINLGGGTKPDGVSHDGGSIPSLIEVHWGRPNFGYHGWYFNTIDTTTADLRKQKDGDSLARRESFIISGKEAGDLATLQRELHAGEWNISEASFDIMKEPDPAKRYAAAEKDHIVAAAEIPESGSPYVFFLGGNDLEMERIREVLEETGTPYVDGDPGWGAKASTYRFDIEAAAAKGKTPVWVKLEPDIPAGTSHIIDHHGARANEPASLLQVLNILGLEPTREDVLIAANDAAYIPGLEKAGATPDEIQDIRAQDRQAQDITDAQEQQAEKALRGMKKRGDLWIVQLPHDKCATVTDRLHGQQARQNLLILSPHEVNYYGPGDICKTLNNLFPDGWSGGAGLGSREGNGFFGAATKAASYSSMNMVLKELGAHDLSAPAPDRSELIDIFGERAREGYDPRAAAPQAGTSGPKGGAPAP